MTYETFVALVAGKCRDGCGLSCGDRPCGACLVGGVCDQSECHCDEEPEYDPDYDAEEG
jgi:hypothetical protein